MGESVALNALNNLLQAIPDCIRAVDGVVARCQDRRERIRTEEMRLKVKTNIDTMKNIVENVKYEVMGLGGFLGVLEAEGVVLPESRLSEENLGSLTLHLQTTQSRLATIIGQCDRSAANIGTMRQAHKQTRALLRIWLGKKRFRWIGTRRGGVLRELGLESTERLADTIGRYHAAAGLQEQEQEPRPPLPPSPPPPPPPPKAVPLIYRSPPSRLTTTDAYPPLPTKSSNVLHSDIFPAFLVPFESGKIVDHKIEGNHLWYEVQVSKDLFSYFSWGRTRICVVVDGAHIAYARSIEGKSAPCRLLTLDLVNYSERKELCPNFMKGVGDELNIEVDILGVHSDALKGQILERLYDQGKRIVVDAPAGELCISMDFSFGVAIVHSINDSSTLTDQIRVGDWLISFDGIDITYKSASDVSHLISSTVDNTRTLVFIRSRYSVFEEWDKIRVWRRPPWS